MINGNRITIRSVFQYPATFVFLDITSLLKDEKVKRNGNTFYIYIKRYIIVLLLVNTSSRSWWKEMIFFERNKVSVIGCWLNNTSLFWQITIHWNSGYIEPRRRMKKFIFFDIVSFTLCCLESLILQHGADSSMVEGKYIKEVQYLLLYFE